MKYSFLFFQSKNGYYLNRDTTPISVGLGSADPETSTGGITLGFFKCIGIAFPYSFANSNKGESQTSRLASNISHADFKAFSHDKYSIKSSIFIPSTELYHQHSTQHQSINTHK